MPASSAEGRSTPRLRPGGARVVLLDAGDTLVDEATQVVDDQGVVLRAELVAGAAALVYALSDAGHPLGLVADGPAASFHNVLGAAGLLDRFDALAISGDVGIEKPAPEMFRAALDALGVAEADYGEVVMVGNNLRRDIGGANALGLISVWLDWSPRRRKVPRDDGEVPRYRIDTPLALLALLDGLERARRSRSPHG